MQSWAACSHGQHACQAAGGPRRPPRYPFAPSGRTQGGATQASFEWQGLAPASGPVHQPICPLPAASAPPRRPATRRVAVGLGPALLGRPPLPALGTPLKCQGLVLRSRPQRSRTCTDPPSHPEGLCLRQLPHMVLRRRASAAALLVCLACALTPTAFAYDFLVLSRCAAAVFWLGGEASPSVAGCVRSRNRPHRVGTPIEPAWAAEKVSGASRSNACNTHCRRRGSCRPTPRGPARRCAPLPNAPSAAPQPPPHPCRQWAPSTCAMSGPNGSPCTGLPW